VKEENQRPSEAGKPQKNRGTASSDEWREKQVRRGKSNTPEKAEARTRRGNCALRDNAVNISVVCRIHGQRKICLTGYHLLRILYVY
jgi:hypothetical protein